MPEPKRRGRPKGVSRDWSQTGKRCTLCRIVKPLTDFYENPRESGGRHRFCVPCSTVEVRRRKYIKLLNGGREQEVLDRIAELQDSIKELQTIIERWKSGQDPLRF